MLHSYINQNIFKGRVTIKQEIMSRVGYPCKHPVPPHWKPRFHNFAGPWGILPCRVCVHKQHNFLVKVARNNNSLPYSLAIFLVLYKSCRKLSRQKWVLTWKIPGPMKGTTIALSAQHAVPPALGPCSEALIPKEYRGKTKHTCLCHFSDVGTQNAEKQIKSNIMHITHYTFECSAHQFHGIDNINWNGWVWARETSKYLVSSKRKDEVQLWPGAFGSSWNRRSEK